MKRFGESVLFRYFDSVRNSGLFFCIVFVLLCILPCTAFSAITYPSTDLQGIPEPALPAGLSSHQLNIVMLVGPMVCPPTTAVNGSFDGTEATQNGRIFRDATPSTCSGKVYPGIFNTGTSLLYETYTYSNCGTEDACVTVNWDAGTMGTMAHIVAYLNSYDPTDQGLNYLGDIGSSLTGSFSFTVPANQDLVLVVNTNSSSETGSYSFTISGLPCQAVGSCIQPIVTANAAGSGAGTVQSNDGGINYSYPANNTGTTVPLNIGTNVVLTATAGTGSTVAWTTCTGAASGNGTGTATCAFSSLDGNMTAGATFTLIDSVTVPSATGNGNITVQTTSPGCGLYNVAAKTEAQVGNDPSYNYPYGLVEFTLNCESADVTITFPGNITGTQYRKYGPVTPGDFNTTAWYDFNGTITGNQITLHLEDNKLGDDTGDDGIIVDQGGPGQPDVNGSVAVPTMNEWGMIIFMALAGLSCVYYIRRQRRA